MKKLLTVAMSACAALGLTATANAAVIDFANDANTVGERALQLTAAGVANLTIDSVAMRLTAGDFFPYLDASAPDMPAGLGVCQILDNESSRQCVPGSDDNVTISETVTIEFLSGFFSILEISFRGEGHIDFNSNNVNTLLINAVEYTFAQAFALAQTGFFAGSQITFAFGGSNPDQFYVNLISDVPLPGALTLLLSGLAGLGFASRRKRAA